jgi:hypothetical protein
VDPAVGFRRRLRLLVWRARRWPSFSRRRNRLLALFPEDRLIRNGDRQPAGAAAAEVADLVVRRRAAPPPGAGLGAKLDDVRSAASGGLIRSRRSTRPTLRHARRREPVGCRPSRWGEAASSDARSKVGCPKMPKSRRIWPFQAATTVVGFGELRSKTTILRRRPFDPALALALRRPT